MALGDLAGGSVAAAGVKVVLDADPIGIVKGFAQADTAGKKFAATLGGLENIGKSALKTVQGTLDGIERSARKLRNAGIGLGIGLIGATYGAMQLEGALHNVATIDKSVSKNFDESTAQVIRMSRTLPESATNIAKAWYEIASSGFYGSEGTMVLTQALKAGVAGVSNTAEAGMALTAVLNAYGLSANKARTVSDLMFQTVNLGVLHFSDLAGVVGDSVGTAAAAGVKFKDVGAAIATMTLSGISASESGTSLNRLIQSMIKPSDALTQAWSRLSSQTLTQALATQGLKSVMDQLRVASGGNVEVLLAWFDEIRAARGALALMSNEGATYNRVMKGMDDATKGQGATQRAFNEQMQSASMQFKLLVNQVKQIGLEIGTALLPVAKAGIRTALLFTSAWDAIPKPIKEVIAYLGALSSVLSIITGMLVVFAAKMALSAGTSLLLGRGLQTVGNIITGWGPTFARAGTQVGLLGTRVGEMGRSFSLFSLITGPVRAVGVAFQTVGLAIAGINPRMERFGLAIGGMGDKIRSVANALPAMAAGLTVLAAGLVLIGSAWSQSRQQATAWADNIESKLNLNTFGGVTKGIQTFSKESDIAWKKAINKWGAGQIDKFGFGDFGMQAVIAGKAMKAGFAQLGSGITNLIGMGKAFGDPFGDLNKAKEAQSRYQKLTAQLGSMKAAALAVMHTMSITDPGIFDKMAAGTQEESAKRYVGFFNLVSSAAKNLGINIKDGKRLTVSQLTDLQNEVNKMAGGVGLSADKAAEFGPKVQKALEDAAKEVNKFVKSAGDSLMKGFDIAGAVTESGKAGQDQLKGLLFGYTVQAAGFVDDIEALMKRGLDPMILQQLVLAGPEAAHNAIRAFLDDSSNQLIEMGNTAVETLRGIRMKLEVEANIIAKAAQRPDLAGQMGQAMQMADVIKTLGPRATPEKVAFAMGIDPNAARQIWQAFFAEVPITSMDPVVDNLITGFEKKFGPGLREGINIAADKAQITDAQVGMIFEKYTTGGKKAAEDVAHKLGLTDKQIEIVLGILGYEDAQGKIGKVDENLMILDKKRPKPKVDADTDGANQKLDHTGGKADDVGRKNPHVRVDAETSDAEAALARVITMITGIPPSRQFNINVDAQISANAAAYLAGQAGIGIAKGGIFMGGVKKFAGGGENHGAQISNGLRIWGEPETGGEAYIPLHHGRANKRSMQVLKHVAEMFGYALADKQQTRRFGDGGIVAGSQSSGSIGQTVVIQSNVTFTGNIAGHDEFRSIAKDVMDRRDRQVAISISRKG